MTIHNPDGSFVHSYVPRLLAGLFVCAVSVVLFTSSAAQAQIIIEPDLGDGPADIEIVAVGGSELTGTITKVKVRVKASGHKLIVKHELCNEGDETAGEFPVSLFLSEDGIWDADDEPLQTVMIESLNPGVCITKPHPAHKFKVKGIPSLHGMFAIVVIDPNEDVTNELTTTDNVLITAIEGPFLSSGKRVPGQFLTIAHPSIQEGSMVDVTFRGPNGYEVSTMADLTTPGRVKVATPPFIDVATSRVLPGTVTVSVDGATSPFATLKVLDLPQVDAEPGAITREVLLFAMENYDGVVSKLQQTSADTGLDSEALVTSIAAIQASLEAMAEELAEQRLTLGVDDGFVTIEAEQLQLLDRLVAAHFIGTIDEAMAITANQASLTGVQSVRRAQSQFLTREGIGEMLREIKAQGIPGMQLLGAYVSVTAGTVGLVAVVIPGGQPLAAAAAGMAVFSTVIVTTTTAITSFVADLTIDAVEGRTPDAYNAGQNALVVVEDGVTSVVLTAGGAISWAGATLSSIGGLVFDAHGGLTAARDLQCASSPSNLTSIVKEVTIAQAPSVPIGEFCSLTDPDAPAEPPADDGTSTPPGTTAPDVDIPPLPDGFPGLGVMAVNIAIPGFSTIFTPELTTGVRLTGPIGDAALPLIVLVRAMQNATDPSNIKLLDLSFNPSQIAGPSTISVGTPDQLSDDSTVPASVRLVSSDLKDDDEQLISFESVSGTVTLTTADFASGGRVVGTFSVTIQGTREDAEGNDEIITGSITGSFDVPVF